MKSESVKSSSIIQSSRLSEQLLAVGRLLKQEADELPGDRLFCHSADTLQQAILSHIPDFLWVKDLDCRFLVANAAMAQSTPYRTPEALVGKCDFDFHAPADAERFSLQEKEIMRTGIGFSDVEESYVGPDGQRRYVSTSKMPLRDDAGHVIGIVGSSRDITIQIQSNQLQQGQARLMEMIARSEAIEDILHALILLIEKQITGIACSIMLLDDSGTCLKYGAAANIPPEWSMLVNGMPIGPDSAPCGTAAWLGEPVYINDITTNPLWAEFRAMTAPFGLRSCWSTPIMSHHGKILGTFTLYSREVQEPTEPTRDLMGFATHIAGIALERKHTQDRISAMAHRDFLTGLPNRSLLNSRMEAAIATASNTGGGVLVAFIDLDNFKLVNDSLGHAVGDELLIVLSNRIMEEARGKDLVFRLGGDEFVVILEDHNPDCSNALDVLQRIQKSITMPVEIDANVLNVSASIGAAFYPKNGRSSSDLLARADIAMYRSKQMGRDCCHEFSPDMETNSREQMLLKEELRLATSRGELLLHYQPQLRQSTGQIFGVEALVRWQHPEKGMISPAVFIGIAEDSGIINEIGEWVLREACRQNRQWQLSGLLKIAVSVNVSAYQFRNAGFAASVARVLDETGLAPEFLELELTESMIMHDVAKAIETMLELEKLGVRLAIDDFGTGFSSLSALKRFPVSRLKIDQSFISGLPDDESDAAIASAVISMAQKLKLQVIAEGVETQAQADFLRHAGCDEIQGYWISRPVTADVLCEGFLSAAENSQQCSV